MFVDDLFDKKTLTEAQGGGSPWHSEPEQQQMDADRRGRLGRERNAGLDEPDDAAPGSVQTGNGVYEYTVPAGQESTAQELGLQQHRGHWFSRVPIQRANFQFGQPQFHEIPSPGVAEGKRMKTASGMYRDQHTGVAYRGKTGQDGNDSYMTPDYLIQKYQERLAQIASGPYKRPKEVAQLKSRIAKLQGQQGVAEAGNKPLEKSRFGTGDTRTPRDIKSQMSGASDEFVKSTADKTTGPFHSKVAKMQGKMAKSELRRREQGVGEGYQFKGPFPFDVDHMHGGRGINLPKAETKKYFTDKKQWQRAVDDINSSKYDDNSDYIGVTGRSTVEINGREWARWSDAQQKGYIELSSMSEQGMAEGMLDNPGEQDSPVASAIIRRILMQRTDLLAKHGPEKVGAAVDEVADFVGDVDEIGSSDVSGWVRHVEQMLGNMSEGKQVNELSFKDIQKSANRFAKGANKFTKNVADTGAAVGNAAGALGGAIKQVGKTAIADPVAATYNATKSGLGRASNVAANTYGDLKKGVQTVGKAGQTVGSDIGAAGTAVGKGIQSVGRGVANVAGGATGALGSVAGGATTGLGRAAARGFNTGVQNVGGDAIDKMQTNIMTPKAADIQKKIATKQDEIKALQAALAGEQSSAPAGGKAGIQTGATALIDPDTNRPYEKDKLAAMYGYKEPAAAAAKTSTAPAAQPQGFSATNVMNLPGMSRTPAKSAAPARTANFAGPGGYGATTTGIRAPAAPSSPALAAPKLPAAPRVTAGGPTPAEKANLDKRIAAAAPAVAETLAQIDRMLESVNSKKSAEIIKAYADQRFTELGLRNTTECRNIMAHVVHESAVRRRAYAQRLAK
jgi:hypothetical protein